MQHIATDRTNVLGVGINNINLKSATARVIEGVKNGIQGYVCVTGVHGVSEAQKSREFRDILNHAFMNTPDGMPMVWMGKLAGNKEIDRVYGPDLMLEIFKISDQHNLRHYFFGGGEGVAERLKLSLLRKFPQSQIVGTYTPPFRPLTNEEESELVRRLIETKPNLMWVGLSTPKQERFMADFLKRRGSAQNDCKRGFGGPLIMFGVGAAFDFHAGGVRQAPRWIQRSGLEWLFRLSMEPRRLWKRYLKNNPIFIVRAILQLIGIRRYNLH